MAEPITQGSYAVGSATITWTAHVTDTSLHEFLRAEQDKTYEVVCWRPLPDGMAELVTWEVPGDILDAFLFDHEGEIGTIVSIRVVSNGPRAD